MNSARPSDVVALLRRLNFRPSRLLGQNFLVDANILAILLRSANVKSTDTILEVGPGLGILTGPLLERANHVAAIEKDDRLHTYLKEAFFGNDKLELIHDDAMQFDLETLPNLKTGKLISNLPYSIASRFLVAVTESGNRPTRMVVTVQQEVGDRLAASPGTKDYGLLSVLVQLRYQVKLVRVISPSCFYPRPKIRSAIVRFDAEPDTKIAVRDAQSFKALVRHAFSRRRKQLGSLLPSAPGTLRVDRTSSQKLIRAANLDPSARPESLAVIDWIRLSNACVQRNST